MGRQYVVNLGTTVLTSGGTKSLFLVNPATVGFKVIEFGISMDNVTTNAEPVRIVLYRVSTLGSPAGATATMVPLDDAFEAAQSTALQILTAEPTSVTPMLSWYIQPNSGLLVMQWPLGREPAAKGAGSRLGVQYVSPTGVTATVASYIIIEE